MPSPSRRASVVVIGSINLDLVVRTPRLPQPGETLTGTTFRTLPGGKGANQAVAVARLGGRAHMVGRVGADAFGRQLLQGLRKEGVDTRHTRALPRTSTGVATIQVDDEARNPADIKALEPIIARADAVLLQLEIPLDTVAAALRIALRHDVFTVLDAAPIPPDGLPDTLRDIDILSPNQSEAALLTGGPCNTPEEATHAASILIQRFNPGIVVVKLGALGALAHAGVGTGDPLLSPAFPVDPVDTTAAGDAFTAALTLRLAEGARLGEALRFANAAGALATTRLGAQDAMPTRTAVDRLLRKHPAPANS
jgi:ribokinase